jgi:hypothetical protein
MATSPKHEVRYIAVGYAAYALMFLAIGGIIFSYAEWTGFQQFLEDLEVIGETVLLITGGFIVNTVMAVGSWRMLSLKGWKRRVILFGAIALAAVFALNIIMGIITAWTRGYLVLELENIQFISSLGLAIGYVLLAVLLVRTVLIFDNGA